jgi:hypothetical protein
VKDFPVSYVAVDLHNHGGGNSQVINEFLSIAFIPRLLRISSFHGQLNSLLIPLRDPDLEEALAISSLVAR